MNDLGSGHRRDVAAKVDIQFPGDLEIVGRPGVTHGLTEGDTAPARDGDERVRFGSFTGGLHRFQVHTGESADDLEVTEPLGPDVPQHILASGVFAVQALDRLLHCGSEFAFGPAELLEEHDFQRRIGCVDADGMH